MPPTGKNPKDYNEWGQYHVEDILTHPNGTSRTSRAGYLDYVHPDGRGVRFDPDDGSFIMFLEPYRK